MSKRTIIIDGTNLFIINYAVNKTTDLNGTPIGGCVGFIRSLHNLVKLFQPSRIIVCWDEGGSIQRRSIFKEYKNGRKPVIGKSYTFDDEGTAKQNLKWQIAKTKQILSLLPVQQIVIDNAETDDVVSYCILNKLYFDIEPAIIISTDKDFYQLAHDKVGIYNPISKKIISEQTILTEYNIHPKNWLFAKSICGDDSDNLDGVKGWGFKTVAKLFDLKSPDIILTSESITAELEMKEERKKSLLDNLELIKRNEKLMSLKDPILSINQKEKIDFSFKNFSPTLKKIEIFKTILKLGINQNPSFVNDFSYLALK